VLGGLAEVPVCTEYHMPDGATVRDAPPSSAEDLATAQPVYVQFPGWPEVHERLKERIRREGAAALPTPLRRYLDFIEEQTGVPVEYVGYGSHRDETVWMGPPSAHRRPEGLSAWSG
jgi:adenylosuccinate synthase